MEVKNLKAYLANERMTVKQFADQIGYAPYYIGVIANGRAKPGKRLANHIKMATNGVIDFTNEVKS